MAIWGSERRDTWRVEESNNGKLHDLYASQNIIHVRKSSNNLMARDACGGQERRGEEHVGLSSKPQRKETTWKT